MGSVCCNVAENDEETVGGSPPVNRTDDTDVVAKGPEFVVGIAREKGAMLGLDLDFLDGISARVIEVGQEGAVPKYNESCSRAKRVQEGDHFIKVNGVSGNAGKIKQQLAQATTLDITVQRPIEFDISVCKTMGLGVDVTHADHGRNLLITQILMKGAIRDWNNANPEASVKRYDRIVAVNGFRGHHEKLFEKAGETDNLKLTISRCVPAAPQPRFLPDRSDPRTASGTSAADRTDGQVENSDAQPTA